MHAAVRHLGERLDATDQEGAPTREVLYGIKPKSFLVLGNLGELDTEHGTTNRNIVRSSCIGEALVNRKSLRLTNCITTRNSSLSTPSVTSSQRFARPVILVNDQIPGNPTYRAGRVGQRATSWAREPKFDFGKDPW